MMPDESLYEKIDLYLAGKLSEEELVNFNNRLKEDSALAELVHYQEVANTVVKGQHLAQVKELMDADFEKGRVKPNKNNTRWWLGGLLAIGVLISVGIYNQNTKSVHKPVNTDESLTPTLILPEKPQKEEAQAVVELVDKEKKPSVKVNTSITEEHTLVKIDSSPPIKIVSEPAKPFVNAAEVKLKKEIIQPEKEIICGISAKALVSAQPSCVEENTGVITIELQMVKNAEKPYQFKVEDAYGKAVVQQSSSFTSLMSEYYNVILIDANKCTKDLARDVFVDVKECNKHKTASFSPNYGEVFQLPTPKEDGATIIIYSKYGEEVFEATLSKYNSEAWDGKNKEGVTQSPGIYIYRIMYKNESHEIGEVLIY